LVSRTLIVTFFPISTVAGVTDRLLMVKAAGLVRARTANSVKWVICTEMVCVSVLTVPVSVTH
jgi:hypothetical protein